MAAQHRGSGCFGAVELVSVLEDAEFLSVALC